MLIINNLRAFASRVMHVLNWLGVLILRHEISYVPAHVGI